MPAKIVVLALAAGFTVPAAAQPLPRIESYKSVDGAPLAAHVFAHEGTTRRPAVLLFHGGGWTAGSPEWVEAAARLLWREGLVAIPIAYRLSGSGTTPADALADTCDAFAWARADAERLGIDPDRIAGYGVSAGGQLVAAAALGACGSDRRGPDLMLLWSPALDVESSGWFRRLIGERDPAAFSPLALARRGGPPTAIIQGARDSLTPAHGAEQFCGRLRAAGGTCDLHIYPGLGHLLTRNLANQESDFDVDPDADRDGDARLNAFLKTQGYLATAD